MASLSIGLSAFDTGVSSKIEGDQANLDQLAKLSDERAEFRFRARWLFAPESDCPSRNGGELAALEGEQEALKSEARAYLRATPSLSLDIGIIESDYKFLEKENLLTTVECAGLRGEPRTELTDADRKRLAWFKNKTEQLKEIAARIDAGVKR